jgi:hypothetical protein
VGVRKIKNISWIKWDTICAHRERGGLGVRRVKDFNYALLGKWVWRCLEEVRVYGVACRKRNIGR